MGEPVLFHCFFFFELMMAHNFSSEVGFGNKAEEGLGDDESRPDDQG